MENQCVIKLQNYLQKSSGDTVSSIQSKLPLFIKFQHQQCMVYELKKKKSEQLIIFDISYCLMSELFYSKEKKVLLANLMQLINLYFSKCQKQNCTLDCLFFLQLEVMLLGFTSYYYVKKLSVLGLDYPGYVLVFSCLQVKLYGILKYHQSGNFSLFTEIVG